NGLIMAEAVMMALAPKIGRLNAHHLVEAACKTAVAQNQHLFDVVSQLDEVKGQFSQEEIRNIFKPENYLGNIQQQIDAVLKEAQGESK
ncbi:3-carboxy-cis,cis-muconate cycloisomerase, partial [Pseudomonas aeruginosa]